MCEHSSKASCLQELSCPGMQNSTERGLLISRFIYFYYLFCFVFHAHKPVLLQGHLNLQHNTQVGLERPRV